MEKGANSIIDGCVTLLIDKLKTLKDLRQGNELSYDTNNLSGRCHKI